MVSIEEDFEEGMWPFGGEGDADEVPIPTGAACVKISEILASADEKAGEFSFGGVADSLPFAPGLSVDGVGTISLPLIPEQAEKLIATCAKSPFGHNLDTKTDENVCKSWQLAPDQVQIKNAQWTPGIEELTKTIGHRLGYENIPMQCVLYKLLVYGEGGHFVKHQDTEKEDGMIATVVVQPPSTHEGGDLVVYRGGKERYRHDFGKADGTGPYMTHYAVHYADAEHSLEKVTKGYRLTLVYSLCLPPAMRHLERDSSMPTSDDLADAIIEMDSEDESFALLLAHEYTKKIVGHLGSGALKGVDSARFRALEEANALVPADKKLRFFVAKLSLTIVSSVDTEWLEQERSQAIHWYTTSGEYLGRSKEKKMKAKLNFLNPGQNTFTQLWEPHGCSTEHPYTGNEGPTKNTKYSRFAIVVWPATQHSQNALKVLPAELAVEALLDLRPVGAPALREFLDEVGKKLGSGKRFFEYGDRASVRFCRSFWELLVDAGDAELAKVFFSKYCPRLGQLSENTTLIPVITKVLSTFEWSSIGEAMLDVLGNETNEYDEEETVSDTELEMTLQVLDGLEDGVARQSLLKMAVAKALELDSEGADEDEDLNSSKAAGILWKHVVCSADKATFDVVAKHFSEKEPSQLGKVVEMFSQYVSDLEDSDEKLKALTSIANERIKWLKAKVEKLDTTFSWEMPTAEFPDKKQIEDFLRGPEVSTKTEGLLTFSGIPEARKYAAKCARDNQVGASFSMKPAGKGKGAYVTIKKTRKWFNSCQKELVQHTEELEALEKLYEGAAAGSRKKKCRRE